MSAPAHSPAFCLPFSSFCSTKQALVEFWCGCVCMSVKSAGLCPHNCMGSYFNDAPWWHSWSVHALSMPSLVLCCCSGVYRRLSCLSLLAENYIKSVQEKPPCRGFVSDSVWGCFIPEVITGSPLRLIWL